MPRIFFVASSLIYPLNIYVYIRKDTVVPPAGVPAASPAGRG